LALNTIYFDFNLDFTI